MNNTSKLAVLGDKDSILAFKAIGAEVYTAQNVFEANEVLKRLSKEEYGVVFITEDIAALVEDTLKKLKTKALPVVIPIPSSSGSTGFGMSGIKKDVEKAIGADILFGKD